MTPFFTEQHWKKDVIVSELKGGNTGSKKDDITITVSQVQTRAQRDRDFTFNQKKLGGTEEYTQILSCTTAKPLDTVSLEKYN